MAERFKVTVLKTVARKRRRFESYLTRILKETFGVAVCVCVGPVGALAGPALGALEPARASWPWGFLFEKFPRSAGAGWAHGGGVSLRPQIPDPVWATAAPVSLRRGVLRAAPPHTHTQRSLRDARGKGKPAKPTKLSKTKRSWGQGQAMMVGITQLVRVSVCGSESRGFNSHYPPIFGFQTPGPPLHKFPPASQKGL